MNNLVKISRKPWKIPVRGDRYIFAHHALKIGIEWACIKKHHDDKDLWFMMPFDRNPLVGTWDIAISKFSEAGAGTLRCGRGIWKHVDDISRSGKLMRHQLETEYVNEAAERLSAMVNDLVPTAHRPDVDELPEYQNWLDVVAAAGDFVEFDLV